MSFFLFFFNDTATTDIYTLSLHDALPILNFLDESPERKTSFIEISRGGKLPYKTGSSNIGISQSTFSVKVLNLFSRSRRKTNKRKSKHSAMLRNKETRHRMIIGLLNTTDRKSG